jgi:N-acetylmuramoyl-L-alanine amidase
MNKEVCRMKVYLSPSTQERNIGKGTYGTEENRMNQLCNIVEPWLKELGFVLKRNKPEMTLNQVIAESNAWKPDIHVALHSNAGGGKGLEIFTYAPGGNGEKLAKALYTELSSLTPWGDRGIKFSGKSLGETSRTHAPAVIVEIDFHDNKESADWIVRNLDKIAEGYVKGICKYAGVPFKPRATAKKRSIMAPKGKLFAVITNHFESLDNANLHIDDLRKKGEKPIIKLVDK